VDVGELGSLLPKPAILRAGDLAIYVHHGNDHRLAEPPPGTDVVISGHTHEPQVDEIDGVLHLNPGSAGPRRFHLPVTVAILTVDGDASARRRSWVSACATHRPTRPECVRSTQSGVFHEQPLPHRQRVTCDRSSARTHLPPDVDQRPGVIRNLLNFRP
jgi:hypothetical protein